MVDVSLIVEGTYPYRTGGVSTWLDGLVRGLPDVSFAVTHLGDADAPARAALYDRPANLVAVRDAALDGERARPADDAHEALPDARVHHALSTGAASELAAQAAGAGRGRFLLTEHGLTWREAALGIEAYKGGGGGGQPGEDGGGGPGRSRTEDGALRADRRPAVALRLARGAYAAADAVTSVCAPNAHLQRYLGADPARLHVIPNATPPVTTGDRRPGDELWIGLVGRVVGVKDVQTFLHACALVARRRDDVRFAVVGPLDHDPQYAERCRALATRLGLGARLVFTGETPTAPWYERLDALCLTSVSEAQPLVALEAMAAALPVVCTDVGGCAQLVGPAGIVTAPRAPRATAEALLRLCADDDLRRRMGAAGRRRVQQAHAPDLVHGAYRRLYQRLAA